MPVIDACFCASYFNVTLMTSWPRSSLARRKPRMKPSSWRISAIFTLILDDGDSIDSLREPMPFLMRARKSAMGSVNMIVSLPGRLDDARDLAPQGEVPEADAAHCKLPQ